MMGLCKGSNSKFESIIGTIIRHSYNGFGHERDVGDGKLGIIPTAFYIIYDGFVFI